MFGHTWCFILHGVCSAQIGLAPHHALPLQPFLPVPRYKRRLRRIQALYKTTLLLLLLSFGPYFCKKQAPSPAI